MDDMISRQAAIDALRKMQTYKMFSGDDMLLIDQAGAMAELMLLPPAQPTFNARDTQYNLPIGTDCISRQTAIDALKNDMASLDHIIKGMSANDVRLDAYVSQRNQVNYDIYTINNLPPAQPERIYCKDCKYYEADITANPWGVCCHKDWIANQIGHEVDEDGWCYRAERREVTT